MSMKLIIIIASAVIFLGGITIFVVNQPSSEESYFEKQDKQNHQKRIDETKNMRSKYSTRGK